MRVAAALEEGEMVIKIGSFNVVALEGSSGLLSGLPVELDQMFLEGICLHGDDDTIVWFTVHHVGRPERSY